MITYNSIKYNHYLLKFLIILFSSKYTSSYKNIFPVLGLDYFVDKLFFSIIKIISICNSNNWSWVFENLYMIYKKKSTAQNATKNHKALQQV